MAVLWWKSVLVFGFLLLNDKTSTSATKAPRKTILICLDGFRWDYLNNGSLTNFQRFAKEGVRAQSLESGFVTKTYPNIITLVTGLYSESHGVVANTMYDPVFKEFSQYTTTDAKWYDGFEPLWITNEGMVVSDGTQVRRSAVIQWGAADVKFNGKLPWYQESYNASHTTEQGFNKIIEFLDAEQGPNFIAAYFEEADVVGHKFRPESIQLKNTLASMDATFGAFLDGVRSRKLDDQVDIVVVSDHGMAPVGNRNAVYLSDILRPSLYFASSIGVVTSIWPNPGEERHVYQALKLSEHIDTYKREEIPERFHYKNHRRIPPILVIAHQGWTVVKEPGNEVNAGDHGYDNRWKTMHGIFMARGPSFPKDIVVPTFSNIHVYSILCHILGVPPKSNNGSLQDVKSVIGNSASVGGANLILVLVLALVLQKLVKP